MKAFIKFLLLALFAISAYVQAEFTEDIDSAIELVEDADNGVPDADEEKGLHAAEGERELWPSYHHHHPWTYHKKKKKKDKKKKRKDKKKKVRSCCVYDCRSDLIHIMLNMVTPLT